MTKREFRELIQSKIVVLDGATGSNLQDKGMRAGVCPEQWILEHKDIFMQLQKGYVDAGTDILYAPTFTANRIKLAEYGIEKNIEKINRELIQLSKQAAAQTDRKVYVAGDLTMTGEQVYPIGDLTFEELVDIYKEQISYQLMESVDLFVIETMMSLQECRAALLAVKELCDLPVMVTMTFQEDGRTLYGTDPKTALIVLQSMGADAVGLNCSTGPDKMIGIIQEMKKYATVPLIVKPNAGIPHLCCGRTEFDLEAKPFAVQVAKLVEAGAGIVGGCCGTTPEHIAVLAKAVEHLSVPMISKGSIHALTSERMTVEIELEQGFKVVGERINPTGKKELQAELIRGDLDLVVSMAEEQIENGAQILDVNMGMNGIDEKERMLQVITELSRTVNVPLCIDTSHVDVMEAALRIYPGRALINSISLEKEKLERMIPLAKKYGAMFILLPLSEKGLPKDIEEKKSIICSIIEKAIQHGLTKEDIIVDGLVTTVGANKKAAIETIETIRYCKEDLGVATICGLSNISFGLPERQFINASFLALAIREGLTMAIANPSQDLLMNTAFATDLLLNKEDSDVRYIQRVTTRQVTITTGTTSSAGDIQTKDAKQSHQSQIFEAVLKGNKKSILDYVKKELEKGTTPALIIDQQLIPAINEVGDLFDKQKYFLPQLISSAEAMRTAIEYLEPLLSLGEEKKKLATIVMATVAGDIHDIGKNLVVLMLKNYGYEVIDLGKDVPRELIIQTAQEKNAEIIGLSALMTTTMMEMKEIVTGAKEAGLTAKIIIGGAVVTQSFAEEIGADGYSKDARQAVKLVNTLLQVEKIGD